MVPVAGLFMRLPVDDRQHLYVSTLLFSQIIKNPSAGSAESAESPFPLA
jgi:hypothetical protein